MHSAQHGQSCGLLRAGSVATRPGRLGRAGRGEIGYFYKPKPLRTLAEIEADILALERETDGLLEEILVTTTSGGGSR